MDPDTHTLANERLSEHYGDKYLDIMPYVEFVQDGVHLTEDSYRKVAEAVYEKLKSLGYCK
jgi:lysophospholipase L1-like esterase